MNWKCVILTSLGNAVGAIAVGLILIYSGWFNIAATEDHSGPEEWILQQVKGASVRAQSRDIAVPDLSDPEAIRRGAAAYEAMCAICHGTPEVAEPSALARGLNPIPPLPADLVGNWSDAELFWITKYGLKFTGMPGWGPTHIDEDLWEIVAFLKQLATISAHDYQHLIEGAPEHRH
jgi:mono/diheme cytochrome c family protein